MSILRGAQSTRKLRQAVLKREFCAMKPRYIIVSWAQHKGECFL
jgi:hypothetical protein